MIKLWSSIIFFHSYHFCTTKLYLTVACSMATVASMYHQQSNTKMRIAISGKRGFDV